MIVAQRNDGDPKFPGMLAVKMDSHKCLTCFMPDANINDYGQIKKENRKKNHLKGDCMRKR